MYTSTASTGLNDKNADASFDLQHAMAVMKVKVKKGTYTGAGNVTSCSISGNPIGLTGTLDGTTGNLSGVIAGKVSTDKSYVISETATDHDIIFVPTTTAGQLTIGLTMDGKEYTTTTTSSETFQPNQCYTLNLTVDDSGATLSGIEVGNWTMNGEGNSIVTAGGYKITFAGNCEDIGFSLVSESKGSVIINTYAPLGYYPEIVTISTGASLNQSVTDNVRKLNISVITADVVITMDGIVWDWKTVSKNDGIYAIKSDGTLVAYDDASDASYAGVAIVMYGRAMQISHSEITSIWGSTSTDIAGLDNFYKVGGGSGAGAGYLAGSSTPQLNKDHTTWPHTLGSALSDTSGWRNTDVLISKQTVSTYLGPKTKAFRKGSSNQGYSDWFVPACGQLAYMYLKMSEINAILKKISGATQFGKSTSTQNRYWPSTERNTDCALTLDFDEGYLSVGAPKSNNGAVRFLRDIK